MGDILTSEKMNWAMRLFFAQAIILLLFVFNLVNFSIPHTGDIRPLFLLMAIYYWTVFRPTLIPPMMAFVWGLMFDLMSGLPVGMNALIFLIIQWVVRDQRLYLMGQSFFMLWAGYAMTALVYSVMQWGIFALVYSTLPDYRPPAITCLLSIGLFPLVCLLLIAAHRILPQDHSHTRGLR